MAENITYDVPPAPRRNARDEWEELLETLHRSGTLRVLNGFFGQFGAVSEVLADQMNSPTGRSLIGSAAALGNLAGSIPPERLQPLAESLEEGLQRAGRTLLADPPSTRQLLQLLRDKNTRRVLAASLEVLKTVGGELPEKTARKKTSG